MLRTQTVRKEENRGLVHRLALSRLFSHTILLSFTLLLGITLRFYDLGAKSYWVDESIMLHVAGGSLADIFAEAQAGRPPVYVMLAHGWMHAFGNGELATRALSATFSSIALVLMYIVGRQLFGRAVGLLSTLLMAISDFQIYQAQNFRYYSLSLLVTLVSFWCYQPSPAARELALVGIVHAQWHAAVLHPHGGRVCHRGAGALHAAA